jgi:F1F0 ATPase subunit 2
MSEAFGLMLAAAAGIALGTLFFGGLWWTIRAGLGAGGGRPALFLGSLLLRLALALVGFYLVAGGSWSRLLACLVGFVVARFLVLRLAAPPLRAGRLPAEEAGDAP